MSQQATFVSLTPRQLEVIAAFVAGNTSDKALGEALGVTEHDIGFHLSRIFRKLGLRSRVELALWAASNQRFLADPDARYEVAPRAG